jgi:hypothetical protein
LNCTRTYISKRVTFTAPYLEAPCWLFGCFSKVSKVSPRAAWAPAHKTHQSERHLEN